MVLCVEAHLFIVSYPSRKAGAGRNICKWGDACPSPHFMESSTKGDFVSLPCVMNEASAWLNYN